MQISAITGAVTAGAPDANTPGRCELFPDAFAGRARGELAVAFDLCRATSRAGGDRAADFEQRVVQERRGGCGHGCSFSTLIVSARDRFDRKIHRAGD